MTNLESNTTQPFFNAILLNDQSEIKTLISKDEGILNTKNSELKTPLDFALFHGKFDIVKILISNNADVNSINREGLTPLHTLVKRIDFYLSENIDSTSILEIAKILITKGARVNFQDRRGNTVINYIAQKAKSNQPTTDTYTKIGKMTISYDKESDASVQIKNNMGKTPLDYLSRNGNVILYDAVFESLPHNRASFENAVKEGEKAVSRVLEISKESELA